MSIQLLDRFSPSMMIDYLSCPLSFYYKNIAKIQLPQQQQIHLLFGTAIHAAVENIYINEDPYKIYEETFDKEKLLPEEYAKYEEFKPLGREMIKNYQKEHPILDKLYDLNNGQSELYIRKKLINPLTHEEMEIPMSGRIDRMTNSGRIVEYKTAARPWNPNDIVFRTQTMLYNLWYYTEYQTIAEETVYIILIKQFKKTGKTKVIQVLTNHATINELASIFDEVKIILTKINNRVFERPTGFHPHWCDCKKVESLLFNNIKVDAKKK